MNRKLLLERRVYCQPRTRIVRLGVGDLCDQTLPGGFGVGSGAEKTGHGNYANSSFGMGFFDDSSAGVWDAYGE